LREGRDGSWVSCYKALKSKRSENIVMISTEKHTSKEKNETNNERGGLLGFSLPVEEYIW